MIFFLSLWAWMFYIVFLLVGTSWMRKERKKEKVSKERKKRKRQAIFWNVTSCAIGAIATYYYKYIFKEPCMTSRQKGEN
jgi:uncharacterized membrane protein